MKHTTALTTPDVAPDPTGRTVSGIVRESPVDVLFMLNEGNERLIRVKVFCKTREGLFRFTDIKCEGNTRDEMAQKVGVAAGAIAEQLCALYGNGSAEPSDCARWAGQHFRELCELLAKQTSQEASLGC